MHAQFPIAPVPTQWRREPMAGMENLDEMWTTTMMASGPASGERTIVTLLPRVLREVRRTRPTSAHESKKESVRGTLKPHASRTLTPHAHAARSGRTLRPHAQALRLRVSWRRHFGGQQGSLQIDGCRRCGSDRSTE